jgi:hypothetical protein
MEDREVARFIISCGPAYGTGTAAIYPCVNTRIVENTNEYTYIHTLVQVGVPTD